MFLLLGLLCSYEAGTLLSIMNLFNSFKVGMFKMTVETECFLFPHAHENDLHYS